MLVTIRRLIPEAIAIADGESAREAVAVILRQSKTRGCDRAEASTVTAITRTLQAPVAVAIRKPMIEIFALLRCRVDETIRSGLESL